MMRDGTSFPEDCCLSSRSVRDACPCCDGGRMCMSALPLECQAVSVQEVVYWLRDGAFDLDTGLEDCVKLSWTPSSRSLGRNASSHGQISRTVS